MKVTIEEALAVKAALAENSGACLDNEEEVNRVHDAILRKLEEVQEDRTAKVFASGLEYAGRLLPSLPASIAWCRLALLKLAESVWNERNASVAFVRTEWDRLSKEAVAEDLKKLEDI